MSRKWECCVALIALVLGPSMGNAGPGEEEKKIFAELSAQIPQDRVVSVDDLHEKWQEVRTRKSRAVILDIRTGAEF